VPCAGAGANGASGDITEVSPRGDVGVRLLCSGDTDRGRTPSAGSAVLYDMPAAM